MKATRKQQKSPEIVVPPTTPISAIDNLNAALVDLNRAWKIAGEKHETVLCSLIHYATLEIKLAIKKI